MKAVNLLPQDARRRPAGQLAGSSYIVVGVLGALLLMAVAFVVVSNQVTASENDAAIARAEADRLEAEARQKSAFTNFAQIKETRLASVAGVAETRFDWERFMRELARVVPDRSWVQTANASVTGDATAATTSVATPGAPPAVATPTANLVGCTPQQSDTATFMVRLRKLFRVTDVELNESSLEAVGENSDKPTVDSCGSYYKYDVVLSFAPAPPATEAPRGATRVPASLGGGS